MLQLEEFAAIGAVLALLAVAYYFVFAEGKAAASSTKEAEKVVKVNTVERAPLKEFTLAGE